jgi:hypothetical protein
MQSPLMLVSRTFKLQVVFTASQEPFDVVVNFWSQQEPTETFPVAHGHPRAKVHCTGFRAFGRSPMRMHLPSLHPPNISTCCDGHNLIRLYSWYKRGVSSFQCSGRTSYKRNMIPRATSTRAVENFKPGESMVSR